MDHLQTESRNPASTNLDELTPLELVRLMSAEDARVVPAVAGQAEAIARAVEVIADRLRRGGRLVYLGAGTSGRLGVLDAAECPPTVSSPPEQVLGLIAGGPAALTRAVEGAEDHPEFAELDLQAVGLRADDVLVGIATSGRTPYVHGGVRYARQVRAFTIGLSCNADSDLLPLVDLMIAPVVGPEVLTGSTRLKAGTATKLVLNLLSTGAMVRLGKTFGNLMVDLRATNSKLRARTNRIVRQVTGLSEPEADELLGQCGGELKTALVARLGGVAAEQARDRLQAVGGQVRPALAGTAASPVPAGSRRLPERPDLVLGIDGGGSHTVALLADREANVLGRGEAGPSNVHSVGTEQALAALDEAVSRAFAAAGIARATVGSACLGLAGAGREEERGVIREWASRVGLAPAVRVLPDAPLLLAAGTPELWGVAVVAGTGSIVSGVSADGRKVQVGGWGSLLGDEGSGYHLALAGLRAAVRAADGRGAPTRLHDRILDRLDLEDAGQLVSYVYFSGRARADLAALAPLVVEVADEGDETAAEIVEIGARELALAVVTVARALRMDLTRVPLALAGGLLLGSRSYRERVYRALERAGVRVKEPTLVDEPAMGAVRLAITAGPPLPPPCPQGS